MMAFSRVLTGLSAYSLAAHYADLHEGDVRHARNLNVHPVSTAKRPLLMLIVSLVALIVTGCSGNHGLTGKDADRNGIRDDVDIYLTRYLADVHQSNAAKQAARAYQSVLGIRSPNPDAVRRANLDIGRATACLYEVFLGQGSGDRPGKVSLDLERLTFNTPERRHHYQAFNAALNGAAWSLPDGRLCD
ncbi:hypothetical protein AQ621_16660 (plasmid) [Marinobacter sp. P4B1]|nr:hypothetical protein AQ621_16660 [Marinobacter sp. P4B1]